MRREQNNFAKHNFFRELYTVALENDASCVEALYNLGLCNKKLGMYEDALEVFFKLQTIVRNHSQVNKDLNTKKLVKPNLKLKNHKSYEDLISLYFQVLYQIANLYELLGDIDQAIEWYLQLLGLTPSDPVILQKMGALFDNEGDKQQAYQYHFDSYRYFPSNLGKLITQ